VTPSRGVLVATGAVAAAALAGPALVVAFAPRAPGARLVTALPPRARASLPALPALEPMANKDLSFDEARMFNADVPFSAELNPPARPFRLADKGDDATRATDCLAAAVYYEAGDDAVGERAVAQVVLNRLRHPVFPKTVCGVVFQGSERSTGCQFTFTCDGSIERYKPTDVQWTRAREIAAAALKGGVFGPVGWSTHYHTDYVVPYWQPSLDKLAEVHTQLFYRWAGWWGTGGAFTGRARGQEPVVDALAPLSDGHRVLSPDALAAEGESTAAAAAGTSVEADASSLLVSLPANVAPDGYPTLAAHACGSRPVCRVLAWRDKRDVPTALPPSPEQAAALAFSFVRDRASGYERSLWDCRIAVRRDARECLKPATTPGTVMPPPLVPILPPATQPAQGVRPRASRSAPASATDADNRSASKALNDALPLQ
jgi:hypothetical protein